MNNFTNSWNTQLTFQVLFQEFPYITTNKNSNIVPLDYVEATEIVRTTQGTFNYQTIFILQERTFHIQFYKY